MKKQLMKLHRALREIQGQDVLGQHIIRPWFLQTLIQVMDNTDLTGKDSFLGWQQFI